MVSSPKAKCLKHHNSSPERILTMNREKERQRKGRGRHALIHLLNNIRHTRQEMPPEGVRERRGDAVCDVRGEAAFFVCRCVHTNIQYSIVNIQWSIFEKSREWEEGECGQGRRLHPINAGTPHFADITYVEPRWIIVTSTNHPISQPTTHCSHNSMLNSYLRRS